ncbi:RNA-directed DNA polymerase, eukaryota [Artemisia annua]|uniref:RNA-directed DNA polymerase, eukaryota n=1 Tax=Artemisia annua TaxID=35608 RepID=A0A2U1PWP5_ARTAN|nr:RNA-directed DNA polymerase, eukaryota [Artemisia annua]
MDAVGRSGGILLMWDNKVFNKVQVISDPGFVGRWIGVGEMVGFVNVYGPRNESDRKSLWSRISRVIGNVNACWCIFGDFNEVRRLDERMNTEFSTRGALEFNDFIRRENLIDVPLGGIIRERWKAVIWSTLYMIWSNRNQMIFRKNDSMIPDLFKEIQLRSFEWIAARSKKDEVKREEWFGGSINHV